MTDDKRPRAPLTPRALDDLAASISRVTRAPVPDRTLGGDNDAAYAPRETMGSDGYPDSPGPGQELNTVEDTAPRLPDAFADKTANTLDIATAVIIQRIEAIEERCRRMKRAITDDISGVKTQIHATIELATQMETLGREIDAELDKIVAARKLRIR